MVEHSRLETGEGVGVLHLRRQQGAVRQGFLRDGDYDALLEVASGFARNGADHVILLMPASDGPAGLRRLATRVAEPLRERFS